MYRSAHFGRDSVCLSFAVRILACSSVISLTASICGAATATANQSLSVSISAASNIVTPGTATLTHAATFAAYTVPVSIQYHARTSAAGTGSITVKATSDFTATHPSVATGDLTYTCGSAGLGTGCAGSTTVSSITATNVVTIAAGSCTGGGGSCSASSPNTIAVTFSLLDNPSALDGTYTANMLFTISAN